jgi:hypothetical protein
VKWPVFDSRTDLLELKGTVLSPSQGHEEKENAREGEERAPDPAVKQYNLTDPHDYKKAREPRTNPERDSFLLQDEKKEYAVPQCQQCIDGNVVSPHQISDSV